MGARRAARPGLLIAMAGLVASGKSTLARAVAERLGAELVVADRIREERLGDALHEAAWERALAPGAAAEIYAEALRRAGAALDAGRPVVVDACFPSRRLRAAARETALCRGARFLLLECRVDDAALRERLAARAQAERRDVAAWRAVARQLRARFEPVAELDPSEHLVVASTRPPAEAVATLLAQLDGAAHEGARS